MKDLHIRLYNLNKDLFREMEKFIEDHCEKLDSEDWQALAIEMTVIKSDNDLLHADALNHKGLEIMNKRYLDNREYFREMKEDYQHGE